MLSCAPKLGRQLATRPIASNLSTQWLLRHDPCIRDFQKRYLADASNGNANTKSSIASSRSPVLPGTQSKTAASTQSLPPEAVTSIPGGTSPTTPTSDTVTPPKIIPTPTSTTPGTASQTSPGTIVPTAKTGVKGPLPPPPPAPSPPSPPAPKKRRRFRRFLLTLFLLGGLGFAGGTYYSLVSDNFHDFFTEYVPFGEDAVLYFEEKEYRKRFPNITNPTARPSADRGNTITIPSKSGVSWRVAGEQQQGKSTAGDSKSSAKISTSTAKGAQRDPSGSLPKEKTAAVEVAKKDTKRETGPSTPLSKAKETKQATSSAPVKPSPPPAPKQDTPAAAKKETAPSSTKPQNDAFRPPEVDEPSKFMPISPIDPLKIKNADEPIVQDLVKILNDIITVVNNDNSSYKYSSTMDKAKSSLSSVGKRILGLKDAATKEAQAWRTAQEADFDKSAAELIRRVESDIAQQQISYREEFEKEREKISQAYTARLETETQRLQEVADQKTRNQLLEQAIALKKQFLTQVTERVENERNGRLGQLSDLSAGITELESLTAEWNSILESNLRTQHLQVAVEAVRSLLENSNRPRPFVKELAALKEVASSDAVISAAIASIPPSAYQRGVPTSAQLVDRFRRVAGEVRKAALLPEDDANAGVASHAASWALSNLLFRKKGIAVGDDVESVLTRAETLLEEGSLDEAAREVNGLKGWARALSDDWLGECRRVLEVRQALDVMATEARLEGLKVDS